MKTYFAGEPISDALILSRGKNISDHKTALVKHILDMFEVPAKSAVLFSECISVIPLMTKYGANSTLHVVYYLVNIS